MESTDWPIVEVEWEDAQATHGWQDKLEWERAIYRHVGRLAEDTDQYVSLVFGLRADDGPKDRYDCAIRIPRSLVLAVRFL